MSSSRTTSVGGVISLLGAFLAAALVLGLLMAGLLMPAIGATGALARGGVDVFNELPSEFKTDPLAQQSRILAADGKTVIATPQDQNRIIVPLKNIAPVMRQAQIAIEDHRFYEHGGFDLQGVLRAAISNFRNGTTTSGASSLTQQYVKISLQYSALSRGDEEAAEAAVKKDYLRKIKELKYAITLEKQMSKDQILEAYFNLVYYGDLAYGVEAASRHYFSIPSSKLSLSQAALLAGLTQNPGTTDPVNFPERALARRNVVLDRMHQLGKITDQAWTDAKKRTLKQDMRVSQTRSTCLASPYPYWCEFITNYLESGAVPALGKTVAERRRLLKTGGLTITTTLDTRVQKITQQELTAKVPIGDRSGVGAAAYVTDPSTGHVLAFAQNTTYTVGKQSRGKTGVAWSLDQKYGSSSGFQFGSTAKAFSLLTAMESGMTTRSSVNAKPAGDKPYTYQPSDFTKGCGPGAPWNVRNDTPWRGGNMRLMEATAKSTNTAFVALAQEVGGCKVWETMKRLGLRTASGDEIPKYAPSYILGAAEVSPQGVANTYSTLANDGKRCSMVAVTKVTQGKKVLAEPKTKCEQVADADAVRATHKFLEYNMTNGSGIRNQLDGRQSAGKTGTADGNNESWFVGYTPNLVTSVWVGTPDDGNKRRMFNVKVGGTTYPVMHGASIAAPIWKGIMNRALEGEPVLRFKEPSDKYTKSNEVPIPDLRGRSVQEAGQILIAAGFSWRHAGTMNSDVPAGLVAGWSPTGVAEKGIEVTIYTSTGVGGGPGNGNGNNPQPTLPPPPDGWPFPTPTKTKGRG